MTSPLGCFNGGGSLQAEAPWLAGHKAYGRGNRRSGTERKPRQAYSNKQLETLEDEFQVTARAMRMVQTVGRYHFLAREVLDCKQENGTVEIVEVDGKSSEDVVSEQKVGGVLTRNEYLHECGMSERLPGKYGGTSMYNRFLLRSSLYVPSFFSKFCSE